MLPYQINWEMTLKVLTLQNFDYNKSNTILDRKGSIQFSGIYHSPLDFNKCLLFIFLVDTMPSDFTSTTFKERINIHVRNKKSCTILY